MGAERVVAAGRDRARLEQLLSEGADDTVAITPDEAETAAAFAAAAADVDVVLDYVWGPVTENAMTAIDRARTDHVQLLDWVQVGGMAGTEIALGGYLLTHNAMRVSGSGFGSVPMQHAELQQLAASIAAGDLTVTPRSVPLADVEAAWTHEDDRRERTVVIP